MNKKNLIPLDLYFSNAYKGPTTMEVPDSVLKVILVKYCSDKVVANAVVKAYYDKMITFSKNGTAALTKSR